MKMAFDFLSLPESRSTEKPRRTGQTMMIDMGLSPALVRDHLRVVAPYVDVAKIFVGSARLYDETVLREKIDIYGESDVDIFIGGQFVEYALYKHGIEMVPRFMDEVRDLGIHSIEISDNCIELGDDVRRRLIGIGRDAGLEVHGEVGSKDEKAEISELIRQAEVCFDAGCEMVLFEAAELVEQGAINAASIEAIKAAIAPEKLMIELPGTWINGVTQNDIFEMMKYTLRTFGSDANLGNVMWDQVINLEALRCELGIAGPSYIASNQWK